MSETKEQKMIREHQEDLQRIRAFRPIDDVFMRALFFENLPLAQMVLRIVTATPDLTLTHCETQADLKHITGARSLTLDLYASDTSGKKYDLEVQKRSDGAQPHRARYHSSVLDVENLYAAQEFEALPDTYVIFLTEADYFKKGAPVYSIRRTNQQADAPFADGASILYVNGDYRGDDDLGRLMHDFLCSDPDQMYLSPLADRCRFFKQDPKGVKIVCDILQDMRETAHAEGRTEGKSEGMHLFAMLIQKLNALGRSEDIKKAAEDDHYRDQLIGELIGK